jgi:hypothetical protein
LKTWTLDDATSAFHEIAQRALTHHPQRVELGGRDAVVVVNAVDYAALTFARDLVEFIRRSAVLRGVPETALERPTSHDVRRDAPGGLEDQ